MLESATSALENSHPNEAALIIFLSLSHPSTETEIKRNEEMKANQAPRYCRNRAYDGVQWLGSIKEGFLEEENINGNHRLKRISLKSLQIN